MDTQTTQNNILLFKALKDNNKIRIFIQFNHRE